MQWNYAITNNTLALANSLKKSTGRAYALTLLNAVIRDYAQLRAVGQYQCKNYQALRDEVINLRVRLLGIKYSYIDSQVGKWSK